MPFQQAVPQSPGWQPQVSNQEQEQILNQYLGLLNVSTVEQARKLPFSALQVANIIQVGGAFYGSFVYGPTVDGDFVPALPGELLLHGQFDKSLRVMPGHNADEVGHSTCFPRDYVNRDRVYSSLRLSSRTRLR